MAFEVVGAIGGITQGVARLLGLSKSARLRRAINDHVKLYASLENHDELKQARVQVASLIELQTNQLFVREVIAANRVYDWSNLIVGVFLAAICGAPLLWLVPPHAWWRWAVAIFSGTVAALFLIFGATMVRKQPTVEELAAAAANAANEVGAELPSQPHSIDA